ncbi:hypothetical protein Tco_1434236 [Tanacetum coccineum]
MTNTLKAKKAESKKAKAGEEPEEQHESLVRSGRGKGYMRSGDQEANVPNAFKKNVVPRKARSLTVADNIVEEQTVVELAKSLSIEEHRHQQCAIMTQLTIDQQIEKDVEDTYAEWVQKLKGLEVEDPIVQLLLDLRKGSKASQLESMKQMKQAVTGKGSSVAHNKYYEFENILATNNDATRGSSCSDTGEEKDDETDDSDDSDMDLSEDEPKRDDDATGFGVFMYNKSTKPLKSTYLSLTVTSSSLEYIQSLLNETPTNELTDFMSNLVYTDAQTTSAAVYPEGNHKLTSYISEAAHHNLSPQANTTSYPTTNPQHISLHAKAKKLMQKANKNMRKINFKRAVTQKFKEYDQNPEALTSINISKAIDKAIHAKVLTEMKKLIPTHVLRVLANFVKPRLNNSVLELKLLNRIHESKTHPKNQKLYDTLYESIILDQETLNAQNAETSFHKRSHDHQDPPTDREREKGKKRRKDVDLFSKSSKKDKTPMIHAKKYTPADQPQDQEDLYVQECLNAGWFMKKSSPSTMAIEKKIKEIIQKDELIIADLKAQWNSDEGDVSKTRSFKRHMSKSSKPHPNFYNNDFYYLVCLSTEDKYTTSLTKHYAARYHIQGIEDMIFERWSKEVHCYQIEALNGIHHWEDARQDIFKA